MCARTRKGDAQGDCRVTGCNHNKEQPLCIVVAGADMTLSVDGAGCGDDGEHEEDDDATHDPDNSKYNTGERDTRKEVMIRDESHDHDDDGDDDDDADRCDGDDYDDGEAVDVFHDGDRAAAAMKAMDGARNFAGRSWIRT